MVEDELRKAAGTEENVDESLAAGPTQQKLVTADGTYATQSAFSSTPDKKKGAEVERPPLRKYLMEGDFFIGAAIGSTLTKLALRFASLVAEQVLCGMYACYFCDHAPRIERAARKGHHKGRL